MKRLSISRAWDETKEVLRRDGGLIATVALALMVLPGTLSTLVQPAGAAAQMRELGWWTAVALLAMLIGLVGQLALARIALGGRQSVGEAIGHGARRAPVFLGATMMWVLPLVLLFAPFIRQIQANPTSPPTGAAFAMLLLILVFVFLGVRLMMTTPAAAAEDHGPVELLKRGWSLSRGRWWKLFGFLLLFLIVAFIVVTAVQSLIGVLISLLVGTPEPWSIGALLLALTSAVLSAALTVLLVTMITRMYLQLASPEAEPASVPHAP